MAIKFQNEQARFFNALLDGADFETLKSEYFAKIEATNYYATDEKANEYREGRKQDLLNVKAFFDKTKFFEQPETYKINGWGYGQTNYENLKVLGQNGGSVVVVIRNDHSSVYTIQKKKYTEKSKYTKLDGVRSTNWAEPFTSEEMHEQILYNAYYGH